MYNYDPQHEVSKKSISSIKIMVECMYQAVTCAAAILRTIVLALDEYERIKTALKNAKTPLDSESLIAGIRKPHPEIADALERATIERFELGKLWISSKDSFDYSYLLLMKDSIKTYLEAQQGIPVRVRLKSGQ